MAVRFTRGDSLESTRKVTRVNNAGRKEPPAHNHAGLKANNTMTGLPGYIDAHETEKMDGARGGPGVGPKREGDIGRRGSSGARGMGSANGAEGTVTKSYRAGSTGKAGPIKSNERDGTKHVHTKGGHKMAGQKAPPTSHGKIPGGAQPAGLNVHASQHRGRMERLRGHVRTASEYSGGKRRSTVMY